MRMRIFGALLVLCALALLPLTANRLSAQSPGEKPPVYTYVAEWAVPRAMWADYLKNAASDDDMMKKAIGDGSIVSYGDFAILNHQEGAPTHGTWFSATSMASLLKTLEGARTAPNAVAAPYAAAKHWDYILESRIYNHHPGTFTNGYLRVGTWHPKAGSSDTDGKIIKATVAPLLDKLVADGALHGYNIDEEVMHTDQVGTFFIVIVANGPEGIDKFDAALEEAQKSNPAAWAGFGSTIDSSGHRDFLARVGSMTQK